MATKEKDVTTTPDVSGEETTEEKELTPEERLAEAIQEEGVGHREGINLIEVLTELQGRAMSLAKAVKSARKTEAARRAALADVLIDMRENILLPSGTPDWAGKTRTYKEAVSPIIGASHYEGEGDSLVTTANALNKAAQRKLPLRVALYVQATNPDTIDISPEEVEKIVSRGAEAGVTATKENADDRLKELVARVNDQYDAQWAGEKEKPRNTPTSPFEQKESRSRTTATGEEADQAALYKSAMALVELIRKNGITLEVATDVVWRAADAIYSRVQSKDPQFGDGGKPVSAENVHKAVTVLTAAGMYMAEVPLGKSTSPTQAELTEALVQ